MTKQFYLLPCWISNLIGQPCGKIQELGKQVEAVSDAVLIFPAQKISRQKI